MATKDKVALYGSHPFQEKAFQLVGKTRTREAAPGHHEAFISDPGNNFRQKALEFGDRGDDGKWQSPLPHSWAHHRTTAVISGEILEVKGGVQGGA